MLRSLSGTIQDRYPTDTPLYWIAIPLTSHASSTTSRKRWTVVVERNLKMIPSSSKLVMHALLSLSLPSPCASKVSPNSLLLGDLLPYYQVQNNNLSRVTCLDRVLSNGICRNSMLWGHLISVPSKYLSLIQFQELERRFVAHHNK